MNIAARLRSLASLLPLLLSLALIATLLRVASLGADSTVAATLDVCPSGCAFSALQPAIDAAAPGDVIRVAQGRYVGSLLIAKTVVLEGGYSGPTEWHRDRSAYTTTLDGANDGSVIRISADVSPTIDGFTITGGQTSGTGGGIVVYRGSPVIRHNTVYSNAARYGGGIGISGGSALISLNTVISNTASQYGGGLYTIGSATAPVLDGNQIIGNRTSNNGGGVFVDDYSLPRLTNNVVARNLAQSNGGGIYSGALTFASS